jgi:hypothetical protein
MTNTWPGPGWWLGSDGNWYPQRWGYELIMSNPEGGLKMGEALEKAASLGEQGWEMVNFTVQPHLSLGTREYARGSPERVTYTNWSVVCFMKRPLAP